MGSLVVHTTKVDCVLRALDRRLEEAGASRGSKALGHKVKSSVKAYIPDGEAEACHGWCTDYIVDTYEVMSSAEATSKVLGVESDNKLCQQFEEVMAKVVGLHVNIEGIHDAWRWSRSQSAWGVSKVVHILRVSGDRLGKDEVGKWDKHMRDSLGRTLNGELDEQAWRQAVCGFPAGRPQLDGSGLGPPCVSGVLACLLDLLWSLLWAVWLRRAWAIWKLCWRSMMRGQRRPWSELRRPFLVIWP